MSAEQHKPTETRPHCKRMTHSSATFGRGTHRSVDLVHGCTDLGIWLNVCHLPPNQEHPQYKHTIGQDSALVTKSLKEHQLQQQLD